MQKIKGNKIILLILLAVTVFCFFTTVYICCNSSVVDDNYGCAVPGMANSFLLERLSFNFLNTNHIHGGGYTSFFLTKLFVFDIPVFIHMPPGDFNRLPLAIIKTVCILLAGIQLSKLLIKNYANTVYLKMLFIINTFIILFFSDFTALENTNNFFRYIFTALMFYVFFAYIYKNINTRQSRICIPEFLTVCTAAVVISTNVEIVSYSSIAICLFILFYNLLIYILFKRKVITEKLLQKFCYNLNFKFYIPVIIFLIFFLICINLTGYKENISNRAYCDFNITSILSSIKLYLQIYIQSIWFFWLSYILILGFGIYISVKKQNFKCVLFSAAAMLSVAGLYFALIFFGETSSNTTWLDSNNFICIYNLLIMFPYVALLSYVIKSVRRYKFRKLFVNGTALLMCVYCIAAFCNISWNFEEHWAYRYYGKTIKLNYINEKMMRFYYLKKTPPILLDIPEYRRCLELDDFKIQTEDDGLIINHTYNQVYYYEVYKDEIAATMGFYLDKNALEKFYEAGGTFSPYELKHIRFSRLYDDDFVLNKQLSPQFVKDIEDTLK